jgi:aminoglycoside 2'-N-acetyltransferase I
MQTLYFLSAFDGKQIPFEEREKPVKVEIRLEDHISDEERHILFEWGQNIFGAEDLALRWRPKDWHFFLDVDGRPVNHVGLLKHTIGVGGRPVVVGGVGGVVTVPEAQGKGFAQSTMRRAASFMCDEWGVEFGFLFCRDQLVAFYERLGWQLVREPVEIQQDESNIISPFNTMVLACGGRTWPGGAINLDSRPW